jgi:hypothetical protein
MLRKTLLILSASAMCRTRAKCRACPHLGPLLVSVALLFILASVVFPFILASVVLLVCLVSVVLGSTVVITESNSHGFRGRSAG